MAKKFPDEAKDVTEPLPGMVDPITQMKMDKKKKEQEMKPVKKMAKGGSVSSASSRADGCAQRGKTRGKMV